MTNTFKDPLQPISYHQLKEVIQLLAPNLYDKIIIHPAFLRTDYYLVRYKSISIKRSLFTVKAPATNDLRYDIRDLISMPPEFENKSTWKTFEQFKHSISHYAQRQEVAADDPQLSFPVDMQENRIQHSQTPFYLVDSIAVYECDECKGEKYVTCYESDCKGRHEWTCSKCSGRGRLRCPHCHGTNSSDCSFCGGSGKRKCSKCKGNRSVVCSKCYGDRERYGLTDCKTCRAQGHIIRMKYVTSEIEVYDDTKVIPQGPPLKIKEDKLEPFFSKISAPVATYSNVNNNPRQNYDHYGEACSQLMLQELGIHKDGFPMLLSEEMAYSILPCVEFKYKHILTNEEHEGVIYDIWSDQPQLEFYTDAESLKQNISNLGKLTKRFFTGLFIKDDRLEAMDNKTTLKLMIYLTRVDGQIEEGEKQFISQQISCIDGLTNSEKQELIALMDHPSLPELQEEDIAFSKRAIGEEVVHKLEELARSDGKLEEVELVLIEQILSLLWRQISSF